MAPVIHYLPDIHSIYASFFDMHLLLDLSTNKATNLDLDVLMELPPALVLMGQHLWYFSPDTGMNTVEFGYIDFSGTPTLHKITPLSVLDDDLPFAKQSEEAMAKRETLTLIHTTFIVLYMHIHHH